MKNLEYIAYRGIYYTIEWYYNEAGKSQALEYFYSMPNSQKRKLLMLFKRLGDFGKISDKTKFRNEGDGIFAFKPQPDRFLSFFTRCKKIIITEAFIKKQDKLPKNIKERSLKLRQNYINRVMEERYYE